MTTSTAPRSQTRGTDRGASAFVALSRAMLLGFLRDRVSVFFTFLFPLMFLVVFGLLFRDSATSTVRVAVVGDGEVLAALPVEAVRIERYDSVDAALQAVRDGEVPAMIAQQGDQVILRYAASDVAAAATVRGLVAGVVSEVNLAATGQPPRIQLAAEQVEDSSLKAIQYIAPGLLSWSVASSAVFGSALTLVSWRRRQVLRRLRLSPVSPVSVLTSRLGVAFAVALLQAALFVLVGITPAFGLQLSGLWWLAVPLLAVGTLAFFAIGMLAGSFAKTEEAASAIANLVVLPMAFLSGAFFPIDSAPAWLKTLSYAFPLRHLNDGLLDVMVRGQGVAALALPVVVLLGFTVVIGACAAMLFSWDDT